MITLCLLLLSLELFRPEFRVTEYRTTDWRSCQSSMVQPYAYMRRGVQGLLLLLPGLVFASVLAPNSNPSPPGLCMSLITLDKNLSDNLRRHNMKHNFPIDYTIKVHYHELFKLSNISRMTSHVEGLEKVDLQEIWFCVNQEVLKRILRILPERHPSQQYVAGLESLYKKVEIQFSQALSSEEREFPERVSDILSRLKDAADHRLKASDTRSVHPKVLLDNFQRTMQCLFPDCFTSPDPQHNFCAISHWRKGRKKRQDLPSAT